MHNYTDHRYNKGMRKLSTQEIQAISLDIVKDIHQFCGEHGLRYSLTGGSALGAIRHNGFIPWDDDMDIVMPRPDYERFIREYKSVRGFVVKSSEINGTYVPYARVCDMQRTIVRQSLRTPWCKTETGVFVDIFPADGNFDSREEADQHRKSVYQSQLKVQQQRRCYAKIQGLSITSLKQILCRIATYIGIYNPLRTMIQQLRIIEFGSTNRWCQLSCNPNDIIDNYYHKIEQWNHLILHKFEDTELYILEDYDTYLTCLYGDYMTPPPVDKRVSCGSFEACYWL